MVGLGGSWEFLSSASNMWPYLEGGVCSMRDLVIQVLTLFMTILRVILFVFVVLVKMGTGIMPAFLGLVSSVYEFHRTQLTTIDLIFEFIFVSLMLTMLIYSKEILDLIWQIEMKLERTGKEATRKAMRIAPHVLFFSLSFIFSVLGRKIFKPLSHERVLPLFSLVLPVLRTIYGSMLMSTDSQGQISSGVLTPSVSSSSATIGRKKQDESALREMDAEDLERVAASGRRTILLWIVLAMYHAIATVLAHVPLVGKLKFFFPFLRELVLVVLLWAQMNPLFIEIVYEATSPILVKAASFIPSSSAEEERGLLILSYLKSLNIINEGTEAFFRALCVESTSFLLIVLFVFVPSPSHVIAHVGLVTISLILPAIRAAAVIAQWETSARDQGVDARSKSGHRGARRSGSGMTQESRSSSLPSMAERGRDMLAQFTRTFSLGGLTGEGEDTDNDDGTGGGTPIAHDPAQRDCTFTVGVFTTGRKIRKASSTTSSLILRQKRWLEYFTCIAIVWLLRCHGIFMWPSVGMLLAWYLSHSLWAGARPWSRYLVKLARLGMVILTPIILVRMTRKLVGLAVTATTPRNDQGSYSSQGRLGEGEEEKDPRLVRVQTEGARGGQQGTPLVGGTAAHLDSRDGQLRSRGGNSRHRNGSSMKTKSELDLSPFDMDENVDGGGLGRQTESDVPTPGSISLSTPGLREHRIADISGISIDADISPAQGSSSSSPHEGGRVGRPVNREGDMGEGQSRRRVSSKSRR